MGVGNVAAQFLGSGASMVGALRRLPACPPARLPACPPARLPACLAPARPLVPPRLPPRTRPFLRRECAAPRMRDLVSYWSLAAACWRPRVLCPVLVRFTVTFGLMLCLMHLGNVWCRAVDSCANCCGAVTWADSRDRPAHQRQGRWRRNALIAGTQAPAIAFRGQSALVRPFEVPTGMPSAQCAPCPCSS
jgi:hypothetical protein